MATLASIFTLKLENKDFNAQLQTAAKTSQDYNNKIANSLLELAKLQTKLIGLTTEKADAQLRGDKETIKSLNQQIAATKSLIQVENTRIKESTNRINIEVGNAQKIIAMDKAEITTKESLSSAIKRRNEVLSSLGSQRIAEEKARYLTLSSLAAQKTKEASDNEIANTKRRNEVLSSLGSQRIAEEKARYLTLSSLAAQKTKESGISGELRSGFESTYVNTSAQNKYNASFAELNNLRSQGIISEGEYTKALKKTDEALKQGTPERDNQFNHMIRMMRWAGTLAAAFYGVKTAWDATLGTGLEVTAQFEQMQIGISALIAANSQNVTAMGKHVTASQKFTMAQRDAAEAIIMLRKANIDTPATLEQLTRGFQSALGPAMSLGFNLKQTVEYSKLMTLAASALTVPMEQLAQETRSILNGTIDQNSIVAVSLGITNAQIKAHKEQGDVYEFLIGKLSDFNAAGKAVNQSWAGIASNLSDSWRAFTSDVTMSTGLFAGLKMVMGELTTVLKNQNGELDTLSRHMTNASIIAGTFYGVILAGRGVQALRDIALMTDVATVSQIRLNTVIKLNPWVALATVIAGATFALLEYKDLTDQINASNAKYEGQTGFGKDIQFIAGKDKAQQVHDLVAKSKELREEQLKLLAIYDKGIFYSLKEKDASKVRIDAITEEQNAIKKYLAMPGIRATTSTDSLISKPREKTAEELAKEQRAADKLLREAQTEATKAYMIERNQLEAQLSKEEMVSASQALKGHESEIAQLKLKEKTKFDIQANVEKGLKEEIALVNASSITQGEKDTQIAKFQKSYYETTKSFYIWEANQIDIQADKEAKRATALQNSLLKSYETRIKLRALEDSRIREAPSFERTFGMNKISEGTGSSLIRKEKLDFNWTKQGLFGDELDKAQADFDARIERIKNKIAEVPAIELKVNLVGWDTVSTNIGGMITSVVGLNKASETYNTTLGVLETRRKGEIKDVKSVAQTNNDIANLKANNAQEELSTYASLTHAVSTFAKVGSKEQKSLLQVEQGIHMAKMAMSIQALVMDEAMTAKQILLSGARATADGAAGIAKAFSQLGVWGFVAAAGIAATLVAAGVKMFGGGGGNGGGGQSVYTTNTGTVLGDSLAVSDSTTKITDLMNKVHVAEYAELRDINRAVTSMAQGIESAITTVFRAGILDTSGTPLTNTAGFNAYKFGSSTVTGALDPFGLSNNNIIENTLANFTGKLTQGLQNLFGFGGGSKQYVAGSGFDISQGTLGSKAGGNVGASTFVDVETAKKNFWGSASYSHIITNTALDDASARSISLVYKSFSDTMLAINKGLATDLAPAISNYTLGAIKLNLTGKTGEEAVKALKDTFSVMGDKMVSDIFGPIISQYQKLGEGLLETAVRVITEKEVVRQGLGDIGKTVNGDLIGVSQSLVTLSGSLGNFQDSISAYYDKFFTDAEKQSRTAVKLSTVFSQLGYSIPTSVQGFRSLVDAIDLTTSSGQETFTSLMGVSGAFYNFTDTLTKSIADITKEAQTLSDAFASMGTSLQDTIDKLISTNSGTSQANMIGSFWEKRAQADALLAKRGDLTVKEQTTLTGLVSDLDNLAVSIQGAQVGSTGGITSSLVGQLQDLKSNISIDNAIVQSRIIDANGATVNVATEGTLTRLTNAIIDRNALLGIDGSHANGLTSVPYDGYIAELHKGERVLTASEANSFGGRSIINFSTSALEAINNKMYDKLNQIYSILNDAQLGARPLYTRAN